MKLTGFYIVSSVIGLHPSVISFYWFDEMLNKARFEPIN